MKYSQFRGPIPWNARQKIFEFHGMRPVPWKKRTSIRWTWEGYCWKSIIPPDILICTALRNEIIGNLELGNLELGTTKMSKLYTRREELPKYFSLKMYPKLVYGKSGPDIHTQNIFRLCRNFSNIYISVFKEVRISRKSVVRRSRTSS